MEKLKEWWYSYQRYIVIGGVVVFIFLILGIGIWKFYLDKDEIILEEHEELVTLKKEDEVEVIQEDDVVTVDIKGAINKPGVYTIPSKNRISDAILVSGGLREDADTSVINLSRKVFDEMVIIVYTRDEVMRFTEVKEEEKKKQEACIIVEEKVVNDACVCEDNIDGVLDAVDEEIVTDSNQEETHLRVISLNQATLEQLMTLSGIGESKAKLIIEYREINGGFKTIDELKNIKGIGDSIFEKIKDHITV